MDDVIVNARGHMAAKQQASIVRIITGSNLTQ